MRKELTKEWLKNQNITITEDCKIYHTTPKWGMREIHPVLNTQYKKYGKPMSYYIVGWFDRNENKQRSFPLHRLLYVWFVEDLPQGYDVDHINNNSLDNNLENLRKLTHKENIRSRVGPGKNHGTNQYMCKRG